MAADSSDWVDLSFSPQDAPRWAHFSTVHGPLDVWFRQTPCQDGVFGRTAFSGEPTGDRGEWLVVCDEPAAGLSTRIPVERRLLFVGEPPSIKTYPPRYLNQFGVVVAPMPLPGYAGRHVRQHAALPWHYGRSRSFTWAALAADKPKSRTLSVFCSNKLLTVQQAMRLRFVERLKARLGDRVAHFGNGFTPLAEKADGIAPYRYTVVLENNATDGFWTEKLADAYLGHTFPIYAGGGIPTADFDPKARMEIDITDADAAVSSIERLIETADFAALEPLVREQRRRVMLEHNFFAVADRIIGERSDGKGLLWRAAPIAQSFG